MVSRFLVAVVVALLGPLASVATAHADPIDEDFLAELKTEGITDHVSSAHAIAAGHFVCVKLDNGVMPTAVAALSLIHI